jgi:septal ring-binding cell division protein DamX
MKPFLMSIALTVALAFTSIATFQSNSPLKLGFVGNAEAIIGRPLTPMSYAGVARRSMYREAAVVSTVAVTNAAVATSAAANMAYANAAAEQAAAANAAAAQAAAANAAAAAAAAQQAAAGLPIGTMVPSLPPGCTSTVIGGVNYFQCGGVYYRAGFQGNSVVYIVSAP